MNDGGGSKLQTYVLDASALVALLEDEPGAARVEQVIRTQSALLPFVALLEVYYITWQENGESAANVRHRLLKDLPVSHLNEVDEGVLLTAGRFKAQFSVSLADALIAAFAVRNDATLLHKDPEYQALKKDLRQEALPYKSRRR